MTIETLDNISCDIEPVADSHLANKAYVDAAVAGNGTASVSGDNVVSIPAQALISCDLAPTEDAHLANKAYVDAAVAAAGTAAPVEETAGLGNVVVVDTLSDAASHTGTSLRDAINAVTDKGSVLIKFSVSGTITLEQGEIVVPVGNFSIDGENKITISGGGVSRVFAMTNASATLSLHRLTITGGNGVGAVNTGQYGGAILMNASGVLEAHGVTFRGNRIDSTVSPVGGSVAFLASGRAYFVDCVFDVNSTKTTGANCYGGAFYIYASTVFFHCKRCSFTSNTASAATLAQAGAVQIASGLFQDCTFANNSVDGGTTRRGGAACISDAGHCVFQNCTFTENSAGIGSSTHLGGALYVNTSPYAVVTDCTFEQNTAYYGGAIYASGATSKQLYRRIERCKFDNNIVNTSSGRAAALYLYYCNATVEDCEFKNHSIGGANMIYAYGHTGKLFVVTINRCLFTGNSGSFTAGGMLYIANLGQVYLYNTVFQNNTFTASSGNHRCIYTTGGGSAFIQNCTFVSNTGGGAFYASGSGTLSIYNSVEYGNTYTSGKSSTTTFTASKFLSDKDSAGRDITYNSGLPLFKSDGYTPGPASQVIDKGLNANCGTTIDLVGNPRVSGTSVDLGAVEYQQGS